MIIKSTQKRYLKGRSWRQATEMEKLTRAKLLKMSKIDLINKLMKIENNRRQAWVKYYELENQEIKQNPPEYSEIDELQNPPEYEPKN